MKPGYDIEDCYCVHETEKAIKVHCKDMTDTRVGPGTYVPKSQLTEDSEIREAGDTGCLSVTEWFAKQRGWL